jgi:hypothetical protein
MQDPEFKPQYHQKKVVFSKTNVLKENPQNYFHLSQKKSELDKAGEII